MTSVWAEPSFMDTVQASFCIGRTPVQRNREHAVLHVFEERNAMILGMNPRELRKRRNWYVLLWFQKRHWSLVLRPEGEPFEARVVDDFIHDAVHCYNAEVSSTQLFLVYEMLVEEGKPCLMLSAKTDFDPTYQEVQPLGLVGPASFEELQQRALATVTRYRRYNFIGCNSQHFALDFAANLGAPGVDGVLTDDEGLAHSASDMAAALGAAGAVVAATSAAGAAGASALGAMQPTTIASVASFGLKSVAAGAAGVGFVGSLSLIGMVAAHSYLHTTLREQPEAALLSSCSHKNVLACSGKGVSMLTPGCCVTTVGMPSKSNSALPLADEPEPDMEPESEDGTFTKTAIALPELEDLESDSLPWSVQAAAASLEGGSRLAPWSTAPSWEQLHPVSCCDSPKKSKARTL